MNADYQSLKNERQWRATTGLSKDQFEILSSAFSKACIGIYGKLFDTKLEDSPMNARFKTPKELLDLS